PSCSLRRPCNNIKHCTFCRHKPEKLSRIQMRRWEEVEYFDSKTQEVKQQCALQPEVYDEILMDETTPKEIAAFNFLLTDIEPLAMLLKIEYLVDNNEFKLLLTPLNGVRFNVSPRIGLTEGGKTIVLDTPRKIRVVDASQ